jgi:hypothetical protein
MTSTDPYTQCQDGVMALMQTLTAYFPNTWQVSTNEFNLTKGSNINYFMLFAPGKFPAVAPANGLSVSRNARIRTYDWNILAGLYSRFLDYEKAVSSFTAVRGAIFNLVGNNPSFLFHKTISVPGVTGLTVEGQNDMIYLQRTKTQSLPDYCYQSLRFIVRQTVTFNPQFVSP